MFITASGIMHRPIGRRCPDNFGHDLGIIADPNRWLAAFIGKISSFDLFILGISAGKIVGLPFGIGIFGCRLTDSCYKRCFQIVTAKALYPLLPYIPARLRLYHRFRGRHSCQHYCHGQKRLKYFFRNFRHFQ